MMANLDLVRTIDDEEEIEYEEDESDIGSEDELMPKKKSRKTRNADFDPGFQFVSKVADYTYDSWKDVAKYLKKPQNQTTLDEKIKKIRKEKTGSTHEENDVKVENSESGADEDDDELEEVIPDKIRVKGKQKGKKNKNKKALEEMLTQEGEIDDETKAYYECASSFDETINFHEMNLSRPLLRAIQSMNFVNPTPIQSATIPIALLGKDICGCAATGTGKTAAFMVPVLERLLYRPKSDATTRVLVLLPTRELAVQVFQVTRQLAQFTNIEVALAAGGLDLKTQEAALRMGPDIVIGTPGRLIDHLQNTPSFSVHKIEILILDEADRMLDEFFAEQVNEVISQCSPTRQTMLFSATMTEKVKDLARVSLKNPVKIFVNSNTDVALNLRQEFIKIRENREGDREAIIASLVDRTFHERTMVFMQTKLQAHRMHIVLGLLGLNVGELHGNLSQTQRLETLKRFKEEQIDILLATDVAARGLDIPRVQTVIQFTMPPTIQHYVHRVGRTARAGRSGRSITLVGEQERKLLKELVKRAKNPVKNRTVVPEVVMRYKEKIASTETDIKRILIEEREEKELRITELRAHKVTKIIEHHDEVFSRPKRTWFQTHQERVQEKENLTLSKRETAKGSKKGKKNAQPQTPEDRVAFEMQKAQDYQARLAKRMNKPKRIRAVVEDDGRPKKKAKVTKKKAQPGSGKQKTSFEDELGDTSRSAVKKYRYGRVINSSWVRLFRPMSYKERKEHGFIKDKKAPSKKFKSKSRYKRKR